MIRFLSIRNQHLEKCLDTETDIKVYSFGFGKGGRADPKKHTALVRMIQKVKPHIFWIWKHEFIKQKTLARIKKISPATKIVMWYGDLRGNSVVPLIAGRKPFLDGLLITNNAQQQLQMYRRFGIPFVHTFYHSFSTDEFQLWERDVTHDVFFGGTNFGVKKFPLSLFRRKVIYGVNKRFKLVVHGNGWKFPTEKWILRPQYAKELRKAHINLGINHYSVMRYYNRRLFECVASGKLHITHYVPGMEKHFKNRKHLVWFQTPQQAFEQIQYYLNNPEEREQIAKQGRDFFIKHHSWPVRAKQLANIIRKML
jgi:hypothetical protein